jgi:hypothetical protein
MTLFDLAQLIVFILITLIIITGSILLLMIIETIICSIIDIIKNKKAFDKAYPVGSHYLTHLKQKFPYGKWKYLGKDQHGFYLYERTK